MKATRLCLAALCFVPFLAIAANPPQAAASASQPGMVIKGDQEAPLVLYIVPWQEPKLPPVPETTRQALIPQVLDDNRSLADDPVNRPVRLPATATSSR
jgi:hypothetical protein